MLEHRQTLRLRVGEIRTRVNYEEVFKQNTMDYWISAYMYNKKKVSRAPFNRVQSSAYSSTCQSVPRKRINNENTYISWCSLNLLKYLFNSSTRSLWVLTPSRFRRSKSYSGYQLLCPLFLQLSKAKKGVGKVCRQYEKRTLFFRASSYFLSASVLPTVAPRYR